MGLDDRLRRLYERARKRTTVLDARQNKLLQSMEDQKRIGTKFVEFFSTDGGHVVTIDTDGEEVVETPELPAGKKE